MARPAKTQVNLTALRNNFLLANQLAPESKTIAIVKANAYGHGAVAVAKALSDLAPAFGVACIEEALELRDAGITQPILLLEGTFSQDEIAIAANKNFWLMVDNNQQKQNILDAKLDTPVTVWLDIDTGMHRLGNAPEQVPGFYAELAASSNVKPDIVLATHFACAEELDIDFTQQQLACFKQATAGLNAQTSLANSAGLLGWSETHGDWNRPGFMLYGNSPFNHPHPEADKLQPVMTLQSAVISLREIAEGESVGYGSVWRANRPAKIATIAIGYGDGYPRNAKCGTPVLINGQRCPLAGRVSMDMITVDVTDLETVNIGDEAILWGPELPVNEIANYCDASPYELLTRMTARTPRAYITE